MGTTEKHNMFKAETVGTVFALWILKSTPAMVRKKVSLYTDN